MAHSVSAKVRTGGATRGYLYLDLFSEEAGWSIVVLDDALRLVVQGFGKRKSDAWEHRERVLKEKGLLAALNPLARLALD